MVLLCVQLGLCSRCVVKVSAQFTIWLKYVRLSYAQDSYVIGTLRFLQRVSIACYAKRCISYDIDSVRLSDRPSDRLTVQTVRLSVTRWYRGKTTPASTPYVLRRPRRHFTQKSAAIWWVRTQRTSGARCVRRLPTANSVYSSWSIVLCSC